MPISLRAMLERQQAAQVPEREAASGAWRETGAVFATETGDWTRPDNLSRALGNLLGWSDVEGVEQRLRGVPAVHRPRLEAAVRAG